MDGLADIVHYEILVFLRCVMAFPALYPLNDVVALLNWHNPDSKVCDIEETRSFVKHLGMVIIETKKEDGLVPTTGFVHIHVKCFDDQENGDEVFPTQCCQPCTIYHSKPLRKCAKRTEISIALSFVAIEMVHGSAHYGKSKTRIHCTI
jgi:hypothetical protein